eukprot:192704_1
MTLSHKTLWIVAIFNSCSGILVSPILSYHLYQFYKRKDELFISKRYPDLVYATTILTIFGLIVSSTLNSVKLISPLMHTDYSSYLLVARAVNVSVSLLLYSLNWLFITRVWLMSYDLHYSKSNVNKQWKSYLDPALIKRDFWLKYRQTYGSLCYVLKGTFVAICVFVTVSVVIIQLNLESAVVNVYTHGALHLLMLVILILLYCKLPRVLDLFYLQFEVQMYAFVQISLWIVTIITTVLYQSQNEIVSFIGLLLRMNAGILGYMFVGFTSTWWILKKLDARFDNSYSKQINRHQSRELQRVLLDADNFELFVQHLAREFSVETMLSFIEMVQFKHLINSTFDINLGRVTSSYETDDDFELFFDFEQCNITINNAIPKSSIVYKSKLQQSDHNDLIPFFKIAHRLYRKYIVCGAELEINISGECRDVYTNDMECDVDVFVQSKLKSDDPMEAIDLFETFDVVIEEMYALLTTACARFLETDENVNIARIHLTNCDTNQIMSKVYM